MTAPLHAKLIAHQPRSDRRRGLVHALGLALLSISTACTPSAPTRSTPHPPAPSATAVPAVSSTRTPSAAWTTAAKSPTVATAPPSPTTPAPRLTAIASTPENALFQLDLAASKATVLAETLLEQEPYIERSGYFAAADGLEVLNTPEHAGRYWLLEADRLIEGELEMHGGPLIAIELSQRGMDILGIYSHATGGSNETWEPGPCIPAPAHMRYSVTVIADPRRGMFLGHVMGHLPEALWARVTGDWPHQLVSPTPWPSDTPTVTGTVPTPWPSRTPWPSPVPILDPALPSVALGVGEYPAGVSEMVHVVPFVLGSRWTYRLKSHGSALKWQTDVVQESITAAYWRSADLMEVEVSSSQEMIWGSGVPSTWRVITSDAIVAGNTFTYSRDAQSLSREALLSALAARQTPRDGPAAMVRLPIEVSDHHNYWWDVTRQETLETPAGTFSGCSVHTEIFNAGNSWGHWLCPGVGFARHELPGCGSVYGSYTVLELVDYYIPPLKAID